MVKQPLHILWDHQDGHVPLRIYLDEESANIGLHEHYSDMWIANGWAKVMPAEGVSYVKKEST